MSKLRRIELICIVAILYISCHVIYDNVWLKLYFRQGKSLYRNYMSNLDTNKDAEGRSMTGPPSDATQIQEDKTRWKSGVLSYMLGYEGNEDKNRQSIYSESSDIILKSKDLSESYTKTDTSHYHNLLEETAPKYLPNYKNPCWKETSYTHHGKHSKSWELRCLPYFYVAGVHKAGTSDLFYRISRHPQITYFVKELHWWSWARSGTYLVRPKVSFPGNSTIKQYIDVFDKASRRIRKKPEPGENYHPMILGEGCPSYLWFTKNWKTHPEQCIGSTPRYLIGHYIHHVTPQARIIFSLRNPSTREYSMYKFMGPTHSKSPQEFSETVVKGLQIMQHCLENNTPFYCATSDSINEGMKPLNLQMGMYAIFLKRWMTIFPWSQIYIVRMEDYAKNRSFYLKDIYNFLGVAKLEDEELWEISNGQQINHDEEQAESWGPMPEDSKMLLDDFFRPFNEQLAELLKDDRFLWLD